jgi:hypothetical protein
MAAPAPETTRRYVPIHELRAGDPHIVVDGAARPGTVLCLSHWPRTPTPPEVRADLSTEIVLRARDSGLLDDAPAAVTVDHYDQDAMASLAILVVPGLSTTDEMRLVEVARVGDFDVVRDRDAARIAFALGSLADAERSPVPGLAGPHRPADPMDVVAAATRHALAILPALLEDVAGHHALWSHEERAYDVSASALASGWATLQELPEVDLAVVRVDSAHPDAVRARWHGDALHRAAVHSATSMLRVATVSEAGVEVRYRYETWVRLARPCSRPRVDLSAVAEELDRLEGGGSCWTFDGAGAITGALHLRPGASTSVPPGVVVDLVTCRLAELDRGEPAWVPG